jgi:hypothetical protein
MSASTTINKLKTAKTQAGARATFRSYTRDPSGSVIAPATPATKVELVEDGFGSRRTRYLDPSTVTMAGLAGGHNDEEPGIWIPGVDGRDGYNLTFNWHGDSFTFIEDPDTPGSGVPAAEPSIPGCYRLRLYFASGAIQEFKVFVN